MDSADLTSRKAKLDAAEKVWFEYAVPERGFFIRDVQDGVTIRLMRRYEASRTAYLAGEGELADVHRTFSDYAMSTRANYLAAQLEGPMYEAGGTRQTQRAIHEVFKSGNRGVDRMIRRGVTPQVDMQPDQLERAERYFGISAEEYVTRRVAMRQTQKK